MKTSLYEDIKFNCDVSDSRYWGFFSICGLLMRYRDLYRSEKDLKPWSNIDRKDIAAWIEIKETRWPVLEQADFRNLTVDGKVYDPFDVGRINAALESHKLVYGAGYGMYMKPTFFLAELRESRQLSGLSVRISGREYVRDLFTSSGMLQEKNVFLRLEPLLIHLHYKLSELNAKRNPVLEDALAGYGFRHRQLIDDTFEKKLENLAARYSEIILYHEVAEFKEGLPGWKDAISASGDRTNEHYLRTIKDLIADTSEPGPLKRIIDMRDRGALGLSLALMEGPRKSLFPEIKEAWVQFTRDEQWEKVESVRKQGLERFISERDRIMQAFWKSGGNKDFAAFLKKTVSL